MQDDMSLLDDNAAVKQALREFQGTGPLTVPDLVLATGMTNDRIRRALVRLQKIGHVDYTYGTGGAGRLWTLV